VTNRRAVGAAVVLLVAAALAIAVWKLGSGDGGGPTAVGAAPPDAGAPRPPARLARPDPRTQDHASLAGTVTTDGGAPVAGARVCAVGDAIERSLKRLREPRCTITDARGGYALSDLAPLEYQVSAAARPYAPAALPLPVVLRPSEQRTGVDLVLRGAGVELTGTVVDVAGGPVARAMVFAAPAPPVEADDAGRFTLWLRRGGARLRASADGYADGTADTAAPGAAVITLVPDASISGIVIDAATAAPVAGATVEARVTFAAAAVAGDVTDRDGRFRIDGLEASRYIVDARAPGRLGHAGGSTTLGIAQHVEDVVVSLVPAPRVEGRVMIAGTSQRPCPTPGLVLQSRHRAAVRGHGDADGTVRIDAVAPATYDAVIRCADYTPVRVPLVVGDLDLIGMTWEVPAATTTIRGRVLDGRGAPVAAATVRTGRSYLDSTGGLEAVAGADGRYQLTGISVLPDGLWVARPAAPAAIVPLNGQVRGGVIDFDVVVDDIGRIEGVVVDAGGRPVEHAVVRLEDSERSWMWQQVPAQTWTAADGRFVFEWARVGRNQVFVDVRGSAGVAEASVDVAPNQTATVELVVPTGRGAIRGVVRDHRGAPVPDAIVTARRWARYYWDSPNEATGAVSTSTDGAFVIEGLLDGKYKVEATRFRGGTAEADRVEPGATVELRIAATGSIEGTVRLGGAPVDDVYILAEADKGNPANRVDRFSRTGGAYVIRDLPAGRYTITAQVGGRRGHRVVTVPEGIRVTDADLDLGAGGAVRGRVIDAVTQQPIAGVAITFGAHDAYPYSLDDTAAPVTSTVTGADGSFQIEHLLRGYTRLELRDPATNGYGWFARELPGAGTVDLGDLCITARAAPAHLGAAWDWSSAAGPRVTYVDADTPAARAGLVPGDVLVAINGLEATANASLCARTLVDGPAGTRLALRLARGDTITAELAPGFRP
jgi:hypothetical protein